MKSGPGGGRLRPDGRYRRLARAWCREPGDQCGPGYPKAPPTVAPCREARTADAASAGAPGGRPLPFSKQAGPSLQGHLACDLTRGPSLLNRPWTVPCSTTRALRDGPRAEGGFGTLTRDWVCANAPKPFFSVVGAGGPRPAWVAVVRSGER